MAGKQGKQGKQQKRAARKGKRGQIFEAVKMQRREGKALIPRRVGSFLLGAPGVILVGEGAPHRVKNLVSQEKKRVARLVGDTPIYDIVIGTEDGELPLKRLQPYLMKLPRNLKPAQVDALEAKLAALGNRGAALPKGPMPAGAKMRNVQRTIRRR